MDTAPWRSLHATHAGRNYHAFKEVTMEIRKTWKNRIRLSSLILVPGLLLCFTLVASGEASLEFPPLSLDSSPSEVREWARGHGFSRIRTEDPDVDTFERRHQDGTRQLLHYAPGPGGLSVLMHQQVGVVDDMNRTRERILSKFGEPRLDDRPTRRSLRLQYPYGDEGNATRAFLIEAWRLSTMIMTDAYAATLHEEEPVVEAIEDTTAPSSTQEDGVPWLRYGLYASIALLAGFGLHKLRPANAEGPVARTIDALYEGSSEIIGVFVSLALLVLALLSGLAAVVGPLEKGVPWFWVIPWLIGAGCFRLVGKGEGLKMIILSFVLFTITLVGVFLSIRFGG
jgi:hypothetical protein